MIKKMSKQRFIIQLLYQFIDPAKDRVGSDLNWARYLLNI